MPAILNVCKFCVKPVFVALWIVKPLAVGKVPVQVKVTDGEVSAATSPVGVGGGFPVNTIGRMKSFSSCDSMWQCQTYSHPKLVITFETWGTAATPAGGAIGKKFVTEFTGVVVSSRRMLLGTGNGR